MSCTKGEGGAGVKKGVVQLRRTAERGVDRRNVCCRLHRRGRHFRCCTEAA